MKKLVEKRPQEKGHAFRNDHSANLKYIYIYISYKAENPILIGSTLIAISVLRENSTHGSTSNGIGDKG